MVLNRFDPSGCQLTPHFALASAPGSRLGALSSPFPSAGPTPQPEAATAASHRPLPTEARTTMSPPITLRRHREAGTSLCLSCIVYAHVSQPPPPRAAATLTPFRNPRPLTHGTPPAPPPPRYLPPPVPTLRLSRLLLGNPVPGPLGLLPLCKPLERAPVDPGDKVAPAVGLPADALVLVAPLPALVDDGIRGAAVILAQLEPGCKRFERGDLRARGEVQEQPRQALVQWGREPATGENSTYRSALMREKGAARKMHLTPRC